MKKIFFTLVLYGLTSTLLGQNFTHSLYKYAPNSINPAFASTSDYQKATFIFRNQRASQNINYLTNYAEFNQPFFNEERRWSGISVSLMNDQTTGNDTYTFNQVNTSYALTVPIKKYQELSFGLSSRFQSKSLNTQQLTTGSQYIEYRGFDRNLPSGEGAGIISSNYFSFSFGGLWQKMDRYGKNLFSFGYALHNLNRPEDSFYENNVNKLPFISLITGSATLFENYQWHIKQDVLFRHAGPAMELMTGPSFRYSVGNMSTEAIKTMIRYSSANNLMLGAVYQSKNFELGGSFDINLMQNNVSNAGTFEVILSIKRLRRPKRKSRIRIESEAEEDSSSEDDLEIQTEENSSESNSEEPESKEQDTAIKINTSAGLVTYLPHELENLTYNFNFAFDDIKLNQEDQDYIYQMTELLKQSERVKVLLTGHTDNLGSEKYNSRLSFERARKIGLILLRNGVPKRKIKLVAKGEQDPLAPNTTAEGRAKNRRVEMQLIYE